MTRIITELAGLRECVAQWKRAGLRVALVPTMGNLHAGHHALVRLARSHADKVVASVFVNPTQFGPGEDFARYPRTLEADAAGLAAVGCDVLWHPDVATMYPLGPTQAVRVQVPGITDVLEGAHRPGHFDGVATVVARLFNQVQPDVAAFGRKDYQQLAVIEHLVRDLAFNLQVLPGETVREPDGLAMSSRNQYLDAADRVVAVELHRCLLAIREALRAGQAREQVEDDAAQRLARAGFVVDYVAVRTPALTVPDDPGGARVALVAARLGATRLIDNLAFDVAVPAPA